MAVVGAHWLQHMFPQFNTYVSAIWKGICQQCKLVCKQRQDGSPYDFTEADVFLECVDGFESHLVHNVGHSL